MDLTGLIKKQTTEAARTTEKPKEEAPKKPSMNLGFLKPAAPSAGKEAPPAPTESETAPKAVIPSSNLPAQSDDAPLTDALFPEEVLAVAVTTENIKPNVAVASFSEQIKALPDLFEEPELLQQAVRNIMAEMQENPIFYDQLEPEDIGIAVRSLRAMRGIAVAQKQARKSRAGGKRKTKKANSPETEALMDELFSKLSIDVSA